MTVEFWTFSKRKNSTARPAANPAYMFNCTLKDASGILRPTLEIYQSVSFNPSPLNYARIAAYGRYYYVTEWQWILGHWEATLQVDALASYKIEIGNAEKYIVRSSYDYDPDVIDTFYPIKERVNVSWDSYNFPFYTDFAQGTFVLGVISGNGLALAGTTEYYALNLFQLRDFISYMFPGAYTDWPTWGGSIDERLRKGIYDPLQFIVSCKFFPFSYGNIETDVQMAFGNFQSSVYGEPLAKASQWPIFQHDYTIANDWLSRDAKNRSEPYVNLFYYLNPFGVVDISTSDFTLTSTVRVKVIPDMISGEGTLQIFALINNNEFLVAQQTAIIGSDINLTAVTNNPAAAVSGLISGAAKAMVAEQPIQLLSALSDAGNAYINLTKPSISASTRGTPSVAMLNGSSRLYVRRHLFVDEKNSEFGKPLYKNRVINTIPGFVKCGDGEITLAAMPEEIDEIMNNLTGGFFYE